jgi:hypothetical protein
VGFFLSYCATASSYTVWRTSMHMSHVRRLRWRSEKTTQVSTSAHTSLPTSCQTNCQHKQSFCHLLFRV